VAQQPRQHDLRRRRTHKGDALCDFQADFYNNVAAIAAVVLFAKVVSHRFRKVPREKLGALVLAVIHGIAVLAAMLAIAVSLRATDVQSSADGYRLTAWGALGVAGVFLLIDLGVDSACDWWKRETLTAAALRPKRR
jgi:hypothetical protein